MHPGKNKARHFFFFRISEKKNYVFKNSGNEKIGMVLLEVQDVFDQHKDELHRRIKTFQSDNFLKHLTGVYTERKVKKIKEDIKTRCKGRGLFGGIPKVLHAVSANNKAGQKGNDTKITGGGLNEGHAIGKESSPISSEQIDPWEIESSDEAEYNEEIPHEKICGLLKPKINAKAVYKIKPVDFGAGVNVQNKNVNTKENEYLKWQYAMDVKGLAKGGWKTTKPCPKYIRNRMACFEGLSAKHQQSSPNQTQRSSIQSKTQKEFLAKGNISSLQTGKSPTLENMGTVVMHPGISAILSHPLLSSIPSKKTYRINTQIKLDKGEVEAHASSKISSVHQQPELNPNKPISQPNKSMPDIYSPEEQKHKVSSSITVLGLKKHNKESDDGYLTSSPNSEIKDGEQYDSDGSNKSVINDHNQSPTGKKTSCFIQLVQKNQPLVDIAAKNQLTSHSLAIYQV